MRGIQLPIYRQPGTNTVEVVDSVKAMLPGLQAQLPPAVNLYMLFDRSLTIRNSVDDVKFTLELALDAGGSGDFPFPAEPVGDDDSQPGVALLDRGYVSR